MQAVCRLEDIKPESGREVSVDTESGVVWLMLFRRGDHVLAFFNNCPHQGRALNLGPERFLFDTHGQLVCPHHGACFDLQSGKCVSGPCQGDSLKRLKTRIVGVEVYVDLQA